MDKAIEQLLAAFEQFHLALHNPLFPPEGFYRAKENQAAFKAAFRDAVNSVIEETVRTATAELRAERERGGLLHPVGRKG